MSKSKDTTSAKAKKTAAAKPATAPKAAAPKKVSSAKPKASAAPKAAPVKKPAPAAKKAAPTKKAAPAKKPVSPVVPKTSAKPVPSPTATLVAEIDIGFGNQLFVRGNGAGLSWDKGVLMTCVGDARWEWSSDGITVPLTCKVVLNDTIWAEGEDLSLSPGETKVIRPAF